jgi:RhtB (resistance to homoserine/threonine) family protein
MGIENLWTFILTALIFIMTPGMDTVFILNTALSQGKKAGFYASLGINTGILVHTLFAALGLSLLIAKSVTAFLTIKYLGALYLVYLGISKMREKGSSFDFEAVVETKSAQKNFTSGIITNVLNPKVALFFISFFPQFIHINALNNPQPYLILGVLYAFMGVIWFSFLSIFASFISVKLGNSSKTGSWVNTLSGLVFILMGLKMAFTR